MDTSPADPTASPSERLVAAGLRVLDELPLPKVLAGATTAAVATEAGVTTGSFFHHFATAAAFADAGSRCRSSSRRATRARSSKSSSARCSTSSCST